MNSVEGKVREALPLLFLACFFCFFPPGSVLAAESALEEEIAFFQAEQEGQVVVSAARYQQTVSEAPASVTVITAHDIQRYGWRTFADVFRSVRGFYVSDDRNYSYLGVRGFSRPGDFNIRILGLLNGHTLNDDIYQAFLLGRESGIDLDTVERIEVVRGPGSALYGTSAFFGMVNIVTKKGVDISGLRTSAEVGSFNTNKGLLTYGHRYANGLDLLIHTSYTRSGGQTFFFPEFDNPSTNAGYAENIDGERVYSIFSSLHYKDFRGQGIFYDRGKEIPTASYDSIFNDRREKTVDGKHFLDLEYSPQVTENLQLLVRVYQNWYRYKGSYPLTTALNKDYTPSWWYGTQLQSDWKIAEKNRLITGFEGQYHRVVLKNYDEDPYTSYLDRHERFQVYSIYLQDEVRFREEVILTAGVRYDGYASYGAKEDSRTTPRAALLYMPRGGTTLKLLYGQAFRVPNSYELFYCGAGFVCNPDLRSELIHTYEAVYEQKIGPYLKSSIGLYRYDIKNLINLSTLGSGIGFVNLNRARGNGVEAELRAQWDSVAEGYLNYVYQIATDRETGQKISNSPNHLAKTGVLFFLGADSASLGIEGQYVGRRRTIQAGQTVAPYLVANITLTVPHLYKNLELQSSINNLFDAGFDDPASDEHSPILRIPQNRRNFNVKVAYLFF